jgi:hypothetical protein
VRDSPHIDSDRLVAFLNDEQPLTSAEHEHVLGCDDCLEVAATENLKKLSDNSEPDLK